MNAVVITEKWKPIPEYEGLYEVSNIGNVRSLIGWNGREYYTRVKMLKQTNSTTGYKKVELTKKGVKKSIKTHRLVAMAFIENKEKKPFVNHIDGNRLNNKVENLEWCTQKENVQHAIRTGLNNRKIPISEESLRKEYCELRTPLEEIAEKYSCSKNTIIKRIKEFGLKRNPSQYGIEIEQLKEMFERGMTNTEISQIYGCNPNLIARRKYQIKNNMI